MERCGYRPARPIFLDMGALQGAQAQGRAYLYRGPRQWRNRLPRRLCDVEGSETARTWRSHRQRPERAAPRGRSEEHTSELQSLMRISYAVFCSKKKKQKYMQN